MNTLSACILFFSFFNGIDPKLTEAIISVESSGKVFAVGSSHGEIGLLQIRPRYSKFTKRQLFQSCTNVMEGTEILGKLKKDCKLCIDRIWVNEYNLGRSGAKKLKHPSLWKYHKKVIAKLENPN
jgi:hypothetical protein